MSAGADMIRGLIRGIGQMAGQLVDAAKNVAKKALDAAKVLWVFTRLHVNSWMLVCIQC